MKKVWHMTDQHKLWSDTINPKSKPRVGYWVPKETTVMIDSTADQIIHAESAQILHTSPQLTSVLVDRYHNTRHLSDETANTFCTMLSAADTIPDKQCRLCIVIRLSVNTTQTTHYYCSRPSTQHQLTAEQNHALNPGFPTVSEWPWQSRSWPQPSHVRICHRIL